MDRLLHILLFLTIGVCTCMAVTEMPVPGDAKRMRRGPEDNWPDIYPDSFTVKGGVYPGHSNGEYVATDDYYNDRPVYKGGRSNWSIYFRTSGYAANKWVLDFNDVSEEWDGTVAIKSTLFSSEV